MALAGDGVVGFEDFNQSLYNTAMHERDFFRVTQKPGADIANEMIIFQDDDDKPSATLQSDWAQFSRIEDAASSRIVPHHRENTLRPLIEQMASNSRPGTSATEVHEFTKPESHQPQGGSMRPSTSLGLRQTVKDRCTQIWGDAARIAALTGRTDSVDDIKKVLDKLRPETASHRNAKEMPHDQVRPASRAGSSLGRDFGAETKPGALPRDLTAQQARQLMAGRSQKKADVSSAAPPWQSSPMVQRRAAAGDSDALQPQAPAQRHAIHAYERSALKPARAGISTADLTNPTAKSLPQHGAIVMPGVSVAGGEDRRSKAKTSSLFLSKGAPMAGSTAQKASFATQKPSIGVERPRDGRTAQLV